MSSILNALYFQDEEAAYAKLESIVWPHGPVCPHCGVMEKMKRMGGAATRPGLYKCYACRKQSRVTVGTVFESSHIKLHVWLQAVFLMCSSKKGISSNQLARILGLTVKSAWFMSHRIREAMRTGALAPMGGEGAPVEVDETTLAARMELRRLVADITISAPFFRWLNVVVKSARSMWTVLLWLKSLRLFAPMLTARPF
jgi:transposase-like protein